MTIDKLDTVPRRGSERLVRPNPYAGPRSVHPDGAPNHAETMACSPSVVINQNIQFWTRTTHRMIQI